MMLLIFSATLFASATLLFVIEPMVGKMILPLLGGTPQVWNTCMVFFQAVLLAGYAYTHYVSTRLSVRKQLLLHGIVLLVPILFLVPPIGPLNILDWAPSNLGGNPIPQTLGILTLVVGVPFFVVATSAPLLQRWFAYTGDKAAQDPYFLYAASNAGSLLALLAYPLFFEWVMPRRMQAMTFALGYGVLVIMVFVCAARVWKTAPAQLPRPDPIDTPPPPDTGEAPAPAPVSEAAKSTAIKKGGRPLPKGPQRQAPAPSVAPPRSDDMTMGRRLRWVALGAVPSSLMLGITSHITTDLSPIPLFWLIPLTLYLLSFILVFAKWPVVWTGQPHQVMLYIQPFFLCALVFTDMA